MSNIVKGSFIQFSNDNFKVIDTNSLVAKRLEGFSGVLRENIDDEGYPEDIGVSSDNGLDPLAMAELLADRDAAAATSENVSETACESEMQGDDIETADDIERMKREALAEIETVRENARDEIEALRNRAREEGYDAGYSEGTRKALEEIEGRAAQLDARAAELEDEYKKLALNLEPKIVEVIVDVYKKVFGDSLFSRKDVIQTLITGALFSASGDEDMIIRVSPEDFAHIDEVKEDIKASAGLRGQITVVSDERLGNREARVETMYGIMDCSIDTELEELSRTLRVLSYGGSD